ncbi:MAG TPA: FAD-dependent oxidoreductase [Hyphomicrobiales bacterium]|nr:FAD-dependent oxidoreductase [Hyphomicrobiales bacterium]
MPAADRTSEVLVIGGGPAGAAFALALARAGRRVTLVERHDGPADKVCGAFVSGEAALHLGDLGIDLATLGAVPINGVRIARGRRLASAALPFRAASLSRRALDEALLRAAAVAGVELRRGVRATALVRAGAGWDLWLGGGSVRSAPAAVLATGKHDLAGWKRPPGRHAGLIGFQQHWRLASSEAAALAGHVELALFPGGYAGIEPVEGGLANLCLVVGRDAFAAAGGRWISLLAALQEAAPHLGRRLAGAEAVDLRPLSVWPIPYGHLARPDADQPWRLGDQAAVVPSFAGDGIAVALHSARLAAAAFLGGAPAASFQAELAATLGGRLRRATWLSRVMVRPAGQRLAAAALALAPGLAAATARGTRIPAAAVTAARAAAETSAPAPR